jgi:hypothetical protein
MLMKLITRPLCIGAVAGAALLGTNLVSAQQVPDKGRESFGRDKGSDSKGARPDSGSDQPKGGDGPGIGSKPGSQGVQRPEKDQPKGAERPDKDRPKGVERPDMDKGQTKGAERPDADQDRPKGAARPDKDRPKGAERPDMDKGQDKGQAKGAEGPEQGQAKGARLSEQQRTEVGAKLRQGRVEKTRVQINVKVGSRIPRSVRLHPLPVAVFGVAPGYRGHRYFVREDDTIVIVDARTYVVVDVIPASVQTAAGLRLSPEQMRFIFATVPKNRTANVRLRLALGAEVPAHVELLPFPREVRAQVPEVEGYRYLIADGDVVIVDPRNRDIALVISE